MLKPDPRGRLACVPTLAALAAGLALAGPAPADADADAQQLRQIREDCHIEAEAAGLRGTALDEFVEQCVADLLEVELHNLADD